MVQTHSAVVAPGTARPHQQRDAVRRTSNTAGNNRCRRGDGRAAGRRVRRGSSTAFLVSSSAEAAGPSVGRVYQIRDGRR
jgi:hypothetical protein